MSDKSAIEWTDATWNPATGCTKVSPACAHCYIERTIPFRTKGRRFVKGHIPIELHPNRLTQPLKWREPRMVFVNSLSDLFHADVPTTFINSVFSAMVAAPQHTFQVLTKRPERMREYLRSHFVDELPNVWFGVSVENQHFADERIPLLLQTPAAVRFISAEPLLGPLSLTSIPVAMWRAQREQIRINALESRDYFVSEGTIEWPGLDWVIVGGESGPKARNTRLSWVRDVRDQCVAAGVPFFFKQWGGKTPKSGGRELDGRTWDELPKRGA